MKDKRYFIPVYYQLAEDLKNKIETGELKPGDMIPSESRLGAAYGVSRMTVRRGVSLLTEAGLIETVKGKGNFVAEPRMDRLIVNFRESEVPDEDRLRYKLLEVKVDRAGPQIASALAVPEGRKVIGIKRLLIGSKGPVAVDVKHLPYAKGKPLLEKEIEYADFPKIVARHTGDIIYNIEMVISAAALDPDEASLLEAPPEYPAISICQIIRSREKPLGLSKLTCRADRYNLKAVSYPYSGRS